MSWSIFVDTERCAAILVNDEPLFALGPAVIADEPEEAAQVLEMFCGAFDGEVDEAPTIRLMTEWAAFLTVIFRPEAVGLHVPPEPAGGDELPEGMFGSGDPVDGLQVAGGDAQGSTEEDGPGPGSSDAQELDGPLPIGDDIIDDDEEDDEDDPGPDLSERLAHVPNGTPAQRGQVECWACGGLGSVKLGKEDSTCTVCEGSGRVLSAVE